MLDSQRKPIEDEWDSEPFRHGVEVGKSLGQYEAVREAIAAHKKGELELWLAFLTPKTFDEWDAWEEEHGSVSEMHLRWVEETPAEEAETTSTSPEATETGDDESAS